MSSGILAKGLIPTAMFGQSTTLPVIVNWSSVTYGTVNGSPLFVAISNGTAIAATSPDGITWTQRTLPANVYWSSVTYGNGVFVAISNGTATGLVITGSLSTIIYTCPVGKLVTGKLMVGFSQLDDFSNNGIYKIPNVIVDDVKYKLGFSGGFSTTSTLISPSNLTYNSLSIPVILGSGQSLRVETSTPEFNPRYSLIGFEE